MKKITLLLSSLFFFSLGTSACSDETPSGNTEKPELPVNPEPPVTPSETLKGSFESKFVRYAKGQKFIGQEDDRLVTTVWKDTVWQNERVHKQIVLWTESKRYDDLTYEIGDLLSGGNRIASSNLHLRFPSYVLGDEKALVCNEYRTHTSVQIADKLSEEAVRTVTASEPVRLWLTADIPAGTAPGEYEGTVTVKSGGEVQLTFTVRLLVVNHALPPVSEWAFHLDLWQNPYAVSRYYNVEPFSKEHFDLMRPLMKLYADAGGKVITASIMHKPWNGQTYDAFESMVTWLKKADGTWYFDYTVFDKWVEFMIDLGVKKQISCYSMVPWRLSFQYFDQASNSFKFLEAKPGEAAYEEFWINMLQDFAKHLKAKGWFDITHIAMDERPMKDMQETLKVIRKADKDFKVSLAGTYHKELLDELNDYCITIAEKFTPEEIEARRKAGKVTTYYTCCTEPRPNTFTFSEPAEAEWLAWHSAKENLDGYLRWALNSWVKNPLQDSRFTAWAAGDTYMIYPGARSSIRLERLTEGVQAFEKIRILKEEFERKGNKGAIKNIDKALKMFDESGMDKISPTTAVNKAKEVINRY